MKALSVGDKVYVRFYNTPDKHFYGPGFAAEIVKINKGDGRKFLISHPGYSLMWVERKEILRRLSATAQ